MQVGIGDSYGKVFGGGPSSAKRLAWGPRACPGDPIGPAMGYQGKREARRAMGYQGKREAPTLPNPTPCPYSESRWSALARATAWVRLSTWSLL